MNGASGLAALLMPSDVVEWDCALVVRFPRLHFLSYIWDECYWRIKFTNFIWKIGEFSNNLEANSTGNLWICEYWTANRWRSRYILVDLQLCLIILHLRWRHKESSVKCQRLSRCFVASLFSKLLYNLRSLSSFIFVILFVHQWSLICLHRTSGCMLSLSYKLSNSFYM